MSQSIMWGWGEKRSLEHRETQTLTSQALLWHHMTGQLKQLPRTIFTTWEIPVSKSGENQGVVVCIIDAYWPGTDCNQRPDWLVLPVPHGWSAETTINGVLLFIQLVVLCSLVFFSLSHSWNLWYNACVVYWVCSLIHAPIVICTVSLRLFG